MITMDFKQLKEDIPEHNSEVVLIEDATFLDDFMFNFRQTTVYWWHERDENDSDGFYYDGDDDLEYILVDSNGDDLSIESLWIYKDDLEAMLGVVWGYEKIQNNEE